MPLSVPRVGGERGSPALCCSACLALAAYVVCINWILYSESIYEPPSSAFLSSFSWMCLCILERVGRQQEHKMVVCRALTMLKNLWVTSASRESSSSAYFLRGSWLHYKSPLFGLYQYSFFIKSAYFISVHLSLSTYFTPKINFLQWASNFISSDPHP